MLDDKYYTGFEGEINVDIYYVNENNEQVGYRLWDGYFESILSGAYYKGFKNNGLLDSYCSHEGWYDDSHWKIKNINTAIVELNHYDENCLEHDLENMFPKLQEILKKILNLFEECEKNGKDVYIDYDN